MRTATKRLKDVVSSKDILPLLQHYIYREGMLYASNGILTAATPCDTPPTLGRFAVRATEFHSFLDRSSGEPEITLSDEGVIKVKCGKMKAQFQGYAIEDGFDKEPRIDEQDHVYNLPDDFIPRIQAVRPFVSDNATKPFATCVLLKSDQCYATANITVANGPSAIDVDGELLIPHRVVDYVTKHRDGLKSMIVHPSKSLTFTWHDGSWLHAAGMDTQFPNVAPVLDTIGEPGWEIPADWRGALAEIVQMGDAEVNIENDKFTTRTKNNTLYEHEMDTPFPEGLRCMQITPEYLLQVFEAATHVDFVVNDRKVHINFRGNDIRGIGLAARLL